jgi:hypothetical protein
METEGSLPCHKSPPLVPVLSQIHQVQIFPPYFTKIHFNIIFPSMPMSSEWSLPFTLTDQNFVQGDYKWCERLHKFIGKNRSHNF